MSNIFASSQVWNFQIRVKQINILTLNFLVTLSWTCWLWIYVYLTFIHFFEFMEYRLRLAYSFVAACNTSLSLMVAKTPGRLE